MINKMFKAFFFKIKRMQNFQFAGPVDLQTLRFIFFDRLILNCDLILFEVHNSTKFTIFENTIFHFICQIIQMKVKKSATFVRIIYSCRDFNIS